MKSKKIREKFIDFFQKNDHRVYPSSSLIPKEEDKSVLFTTAGMQQFKDWYLDKSKIKDSRVVSIQKCFRTSDIEEVGDNTHHTFFEMLGNFSFGYPEVDKSYFKEEAIKLAWLFLTNKNWLGIEKNRISATIFKGDEQVPKDSTSREILEKIGIGQITELDRSENFWGPVGKTGPCGPTVEFFVPGQDEPIEIWNLVFNQYNKKVDGSLEELEQRGVDTGMGLERLAAYLQGIEDDYLTDLFRPIIDQIAKLSKKKYSDNKADFRIIADHVKGSVFLASERVRPSNKKEGYILRRLIRGGIVKLVGLGLDSSAFIDIAKVVIKNYQAHFADLGQEKKEILLVLSKEEKLFSKTLGKGVEKFDKLVIGENKKRKLSGEDLFDLFQTYGFPIELSLEIAKEKGVAFEDNYKSNFKSALNKHRQISRKGVDKKFKSGLADRKEETVKLHTTAHLLQEALKKVLGDHVKQKGQNITKDRLRFDFSHSQPLRKEEIKKVEKIVNQQIKKDLRINKQDVPLERAIKSGATKLEGVEYPDIVSLYSIGDFSKELCLGPHVQRTGDLGEFRIIKEESSSKGVRRIRAILE